MRDTEKVIGALERAARVVEAGGWDWDEWVRVAQDFLGPNPRLSLVFRGEEEADILFSLEDPDDLGVWVRAECQNGTFYIWVYSDPQVLRIYAPEEVGL